MESDETTPAKPTRDRSDRDKITPEVEGGWITEAETSHAATFESPAQAWEKYLAYVVDCEKRGVVQTIGGCSLFMGFCSEGGLNIMGQRGKDWSTVGKRVRDGIITQVVEKMLSARANQVGAIFYLKNKAGFRDRQPDEVAADNEDWVKKVCAFELSTRRMDSRSDAPAPAATGDQAAAELLLFESGDDAQDAAAEG